MNDPRIQLRNPWLAALLAYLVPGLGHLYQRRFFKAALYSTCILGTFFWGMSLGEWKLVYFRRDPQETTYGYLSQVWSGLAALPAIVQFNRYRDQGNEPQITLQKPLSAPFEGVLVERSGGNLEESRISGTVSLEPARGDLGTASVQGKFTGTKNGKESVELPLEGKFRINTAIMADSRRPLECGLLSGDGHINGSIPRPIQDWFEVPLSDEALQDMHGRLGKTFELAKVYTWIAALLNVLAIWDALEGPAYGYGDEEQPNRKSKRRKESDEPDEESSKKLAGAKV